MSAAKKYAWNIPGTPEKHVSHTLAEEKLNKDAFASLLKAIPVQLIPDNKFS